jgi:hypothetical protein
MSLALLVWEGMQKHDVRALCEAAAFYARAIWLRRLTRLSRP